MPPARRIKEEKRGEQNVQASRAYRARKKEQIESIIDECIELRCACIEKQAESNPLYSKIKIPEVPSNHYENYKGNDPEILRLEKLRATTVGRKEKNTISARISRVFKKVWLDQVRRMLGKYREFLETLKTDPSRVHLVFDAEENANIPKSDGQQIQGVPIEWGDEQGVMTEEGEADLQCSLSLEHFNFPSPNWDFLREQDVLPDLRQEDNFEEQYLLLDVPNSFPICFSFLGEEKQAVTPESDLTVGKLEDDAKGLSKNRVT